MACFGTVFRKKKRGKQRNYTGEDQSPAQFSKIGAYWEFSYVYYDKETGNIERAEVCQPKPARRQMDLLLFVTCRGEKTSAVHRTMTEKNAAVDIGRKAAVSPKC